MTTILNQNGTGLSDELKVKFWGDKKFECGKLINKMTQSEMEELFNVKLNEGSFASNEYDTQDCKFESSKYIINVEMKDGEVTHINDFEVI